MAVTTTTKWETKRLGDVTENYDRLRKPVNSLERAKMRGEYPYCGANGVVDHVNSYIFDGEYVLLAEDGGYWGGGENSAYLMNGKFWVNNHAHILKAKEQYTDNHYLWFILNFLDISPLIGGDARGKLTQALMSKQTR